MAFRASLVSLLSISAAAELIYICYDNDVLTEYTEYQYRQCGDECSCQALETMCFTRTADEISLDVASVNYASVCQDCLCNYWARDKDWRRMTMNQFGIAVDKGHVFDVPPYDANGYGDAKFNYPYLLASETSSQDLSDQCQDFVECTLYEQPLFEGAKQVKSFPCDYLVVDVCRGYHACTCSNGYYRIAESFSAIERIKVKEAIVSQAVKAREGSAPEEEETNFSPETEAQAASNAESTADSESAELISEHTSDAVATGESETLSQSTSSLISQSQTETLSDSESIQDATQSGGTTLTSSEPNTDTFLTKEATESPEVVDPESDPNMMDWPEDSDLGAYLIITFVALGLLCSCPCVCYVFVCRRKRQKLRAPIPGQIPYEQNRGQNYRRNQQVIANDELLAIQEQIRLNEEAERERALQNQIQAQAAEPVRVQAQFERAQREAAEDSQANLVPQAPIEQVNDQGEQRQAGIQEPQDAAARESNPQNRGQAMVHERAPLQLPPIHNRDQSNESIDSGPAVHDPIQQDQPAANRRNEHGQRVDGEDQDNIFSHAF